MAARHYPKEAKRQTAFGTSYLDVAGVSGHRPSLMLGQTRDPYIGDKVQVKASGWRH